MRVAFMAGALIAGHLLTGGAAALAGPRAGLLTPAESRVYRQCMAQAWVEDYCRANAWGMFATYDRTYAACVVVNGGSRYLMPDRHWYDTEEYCWRRARGFFR